MPATPGAHRSLLRAPRLDEHRKAYPLRDNLGHAKEPAFIGTASGTTNTCIQIGSIGGKTFYRYGKTFYHCKDLCILRDIILAFMQQAWLVCNLIKRKDCRPGSPQRLHISRPEQASYGFLRPCTTRRGSSTRSIGRAVGLSILRSIMLMACSESMVTSCSIEVRAGSNRASAALLS